MGEVIEVHSDTASALDRQIIGRALHLGEDGWDFVSGDPEIFAHEAELVRPRGRVLDLGMGGARTSLYFAMHGMHVDGYDLDEEDTRFINRLADEYNLPLHGEVADITEIDYGTAQYDVVVLSQTFVHFDSTEAAYGVLAKAIRALKPGGQLYLRTVGTEDHEYVSRGDRWVLPSEDDLHVYFEECACSGEWQMEPHLFMDAVQLMAFLEQQGLKIWYSQTAPQNGGFNVMYGDDWHVPARPGQNRGMITLIGQRREH